MEIPVTPIPPLCQGNRHRPAQLLHDRHDGTHSTRVVIRDNNPTHAFFCSECAEEVVGAVNAVPGEEGRWYHVPINFGRQPRASVPTAVLR